MFDNDYAVSDRDELFDIFYKHAIVSRMQADGRLVEDIGNPLQLRPDLSGKPNALRFSSGYGSRSPGDSHIIESDSGEKLKSLYDIFHYPLGDGLFGSREMQFPKELQRVQNR